MARYDQLREQALANIEALFNYWGLDYVQISEVEYDFKNPTRKDENYGACRFNVDKGRGADFSGSYVTNDQIRQIFGAGFSREDFINIGATERTWGFDIIGLCARINGANNYSDAAKLLKKHLSEIAESRSLIKPHPLAADLRKHRSQENKLKALRSAERTFNLCRDFEGTVGDLYLQGRGIKISNEPNIKYHARVYNSERRGFFPTLIFKISKTHNGPLEAIHRIYLNDLTFTKLDVEDPKKALGNVMGSGIWFGSPDTTLVIAEGPENALSFRVLGYSFVVSTVYATNFHNLKIPKEVNKIILAPDNDKAGKLATQKALEYYKRPKLDIVVSFPPEGKDWNDMLMGN